MARIVDTYPLHCIIPSWIGGDGYLTGLPVLAIVLRERGAKHYKLHDLFARIVSEKPKNMPAPRMAAFMGDERFFDNQLLMLVRMRLSLPCYAEYSGERPMNDRFDGFPKWDHTSLRLRSTRTKISGGILFDSVVVPTPDHSEDLCALGNQIDKGGHKVTRYASESGRGDAFDAKIVRGAASSGFRMTRPAFHEPIPIGV